MADDIVTRLHDPELCMCDDETPCVVCVAADEIELLRRWKVEACSVLADWDVIYVSLGDRGELGQRKSAVVAAEIGRLWAAGDEMADAATRQQWSRLDVAVAAWQEARRG